MNATLPTSRIFTSAVWDDKYAYIFGGQANETDLDEILRYNPSTDTLQTLPAKLPFRTEASMAIWNGSAAYIFGGGDVFSGSNPGDGIVMLSTAPEANPPEGPSPFIFYIPPITVAALAVCSAYLFARQRRHKLEQSPQGKQNT